MCFYLPKLDTWRGRRGRRSNRWAQEVEAGVDEGIHLPVKETEAAGLHRTVVESTNYSCLYIKRCLLSFIYLILRVYASLISIFVPNQLKEMVVVLVVWPSLTYMLCIAQIGLCRPDTCTLTLVRMRGRNNVASNQQSKPRHVLQHNIKDTKVRYDNSCPILSATNTLPTG